LINGATRHDFADAAVIFPFLNNPEVNAAFTGAEVARFAVNGQPLARMTVLFGSDVSATMPVMAGTCHWVSELTKGRASAPILGVRPRSAWGSE